MAAPHRVDVPAGRVEGWLRRFAERHGTLTWDPVSDAGVAAVTVRAADGSTATLRVPFPPLRADPDAVDAGLLEHLSRPRRLGLLLVRLGGAAVAVVELSGPTRRIVASKVERRHVQGRSAAGGWSQQRFARRREGQARVAYAAAADAAARILLPVAGSLDAVVLGGDRRGLDAVLADPRLAPVRALAGSDVLDVPDPRQQVLDATLHRVDDVQMTVRDIRRQRPPGSPDRATSG